MDKYRDRPVTNDSDLVAIVELDRICDTTNHPEDRISLDQLQLHLTYPGFDSARDIRLWENNDGHSIGFGILEPPDRALWFQVHPDVQRSSLERLILFWGQARVREVAPRYEQEVIMYAWAQDQDNPRRQRLEQDGFSMIRAFLRLSRSLTSSLAEPRLPIGFTVRPIAGNAEAGKWVTLYNESFIDHWNHEPWTTDIFHHWTTDPHYRPDLNLVAVAPDKTLAAFCWCDIEAEEEDPKEHMTGWISLLGTRRGYRGLGLGRALLLTGLHQLRHAGVTIPKLAVDAENLSSATKIYESVGFQTDFTWLLYT